MAGNTGPAQGAAPSPEKHLGTLFAGLAFISGRNPRRQGHPHQFGHAVGLHLNHEPGPVVFDGARADAELVGDDLVGAAGNQMAEHIALARRQRRHPVMGKMGGFRLRPLRPPRDSRPLDRRNEGFPSIGFSMKSAAPDFSARTALDTSPWPVITMNGKSIAFFSRWLCRSSPPMPGMRRSATTQSVESAEKLLRNSSHDAWGWAA